MLKYNEKLNWATVFFLFLVFFFVDSHNLFESMHEKGIYKEAATYVKEGSIARRIGLLCLCGFSIVSIMRNRGKYVRINGLLGWFIIFYLAWSVLSISWADNHALTMRRLVVLGILSLGAFAVAKRFSLKNIILYIAISTIMYLVIGLVAEVVLGNFRPLSLDYRFKGTLEANSQGINCALLLLSGIVASQNSSRNRKIFIVCALTGAIFLILTKSRTAFACAVIVIFVYKGLVFSDTRKFKLILYFAMILSPLVIILNDTQFTILKQVILLGREEASTNSLTGRIPLWEMCFSYIEKRPFIGYGYGGFWSPQRIIQFSDQRSWEISVGHSAYLELLLGLGVIGFVTFCLILTLGNYKYSLYYRRSHNISFAFCGSLLLFCALNGLTESAIVYPTMLSFVSMVVLAHLGFDFQKESDNDKCKGI